jgi:hypothetical protein
MTELIRKYFKDEEIERIIVSNKLDKDGNKELIFFIESSIKDLEVDNIIDLGDSKEFIVKSAEKFALLFTEKRKDGYSVAWSKRYAGLMCFDNKQHLLGWCYDAAYEADPDQAENDLLLYCKIKNEDIFFTDFFIKLMKEGEGFSIPNAEEKAKEFSTTFKEQKVIGKSDVYSYQYAYLSSQFEYHDIYIEDYAFIFDKSISEGKDEEYAEEYAVQYANNLVEVKLRAGICDEEENLEYEKLKALAYIKGWDYARNNIQEDRDRFIEIFVQHYLGLSFPDDAEDWVGFDKLDEVVLSRALEEFN